MKFFHFQPSKKDPRFQKAMQEEYERSDSYVNRILLLGTLVGLFLAFYFDKWLPWLFLGVYPPVLFFVMSYSRPGSLMTRFFAAFGMVSQAYMLYALGEGSEFRTIFMILPFILLVRYRDWRVMLLVPFIIVLFECFFYFCHTILLTTWTLDYIDPFSTSRQFVG